MASYAILEDCKSQSYEQMQALRLVRSRIASAIYVGCKLDDVLHNCVEAAIAEHQSATNLPKAT
jgi:hypothetical protein